VEGGKAGGGDDGRPRHARGERIKIVRPAETRGLARAAKLGVGEREKL